MQVAVMARQEFVLIKHLLLQIILQLFTCISHSNCSWWILGMPRTYQADGPTDGRSRDPRNYCAGLVGLTEKQRSICARDQNLFLVIRKGARLGIHECQDQFRMDRWNCTTFQGESKVFGKVTDIQSREKAYVHAVSSAGIAYAVTKACSGGQLNDCSCDGRIWNKDTKGKWEWGGCSDDIRYGIRFSRTFVDNIEDRKTPEGIMNIHNNEAGRRGVRKSMELICKCHGVSGSCTVQVCWRKVKQFHEIGDQLKKSFDGATQVMPFMNKKKHRLRLRTTKKNIKQPTKKDLVFLDPSPNYCRKNQTLNVLGTTGRKCNKDSLGSDGCLLLCCNRGYHTVVREVEEKCNCKFVWCCNVVCKKCKTSKEEYFCN